MYRYENFLPALAATARSHYPKQVRDPSRKDHGAYIADIYGCPAADHPANAGMLACACAAFMADGCDLQGDDELFDRIIESIAFQRRWQRPSGLVDLIQIDWDDPATTGFTVNQLAPMVETARRLSSDTTGVDADRCSRIAEELGEYVRTAATGMVGGGFHTPNHRWVVSSAVSYGMALFPEIDGMDYVESLLAETIDMNADGEYSERSVGWYDAVCNSAMRTMADSLNRPELLDYVRRGLNMVLSLLHPDNTVVTSFSRRGDSALRIAPTLSAEAFFDMAQRDGNGVYATAADTLISAGYEPGLSVAFLTPYLVNPEYRTQTVEREPIPDAINVAFPASRIWRVRKGPLSVTASAGSNNPLAIRYGDAEINAVRVCGSYYNSGQFNADEFEPVIGDDGEVTGLRLFHNGDLRMLRCNDLPLGEPVAWGVEAFNAANKTREHVFLPPIDIWMDIDKVDSGFDLHARTECEMDRITFQIEVCFRGPGEWENAGQVIQVADGQTAILKEGYGIFHTGNYGFSIGPGAAAHRMWNMRAATAGPGFRVLMTFEAPMDHRLEIRYGVWSSATNELLPA
jgi:hypothetical protein